MENFGVGNEVDSDYEILDKIGEGAYGVVFKARERRTGNVVAIKILRMDNIDEREGVPTHALREISTLQQLKHENIVRLKRFTPGIKGLNLVFEYMEMDLKEFMKKWPDAFVQHPLLLKRVLKQLLEAVHYIHSRRVAHRDLKPQNILIDKNEKKIKLADFGLARAIILPVRAYTHEVITLWYRPPEILLGVKKYGSKVDIWSVGCIFAEMCRSGEPLLKGDSEIDQLLKIFRMFGTPNESTWPGINNLEYYNPVFPQFLPENLAHRIPKLDEKGLDLIRKMMKCDPRARISAEEALNHPFFHEIKPY